MPFKMTTALSPTSRPPTPPPKDLCYSALVDGSTYSSAKDAKSISTSRSIRPLDSETSLRLPAPPPKDTNSRELVVDRDDWLETDGNAAPIVGQDPQYEKTIAYNDEKIIDFSNEKSTHYSDVGKQAIIVNVLDAGAEESNSAGTPDVKLLGSPRRRVIAISCIILCVIIAATLGGALGGKNAAQRKAQTTGTPTSLQGPKKSASYPNTGLAAMQWVDLNATMQRRIYYQDRDNRIRESAWDNSTAFAATWTVHNISAAVKPDTPIAAAAGYPHASHNFSLVKNVYYMMPDNKIIERQAPSNNSQAWENDNFSRLYSGSNSTFLTAYWNQNIQNASEELVVLFQQQDFADGITQGRYTSNKTTSNPWVAQNFGFSQPQGSTFATSIANYDVGKTVLLYNVDDSQSLQQHVYTISDTDLTPGTVIPMTSESSTGLKVQQRSPLAVVSQNNQHLYTLNTLPECAKTQKLTNLIFFTNQDASSLSLSAWNCSAGFLDHTAEIEPLQKPNTTFLSLASLDDKTDGQGNIYILFDRGNGPEVEEWTVPKRAGDPWVTYRNVSIQVDS